MTTNVATNATADSQSPAVRVEPGQYFFGIGGTFGSATATLYVNMNNVEIPVTGAVFTEPTSTILWLPMCTVFVKITGGDATSDISAAFAKVATEVI